jgi:catechol-2,3-dioxygenase
MSGTFGRDHLDGPRPADPDQAEQVDTSTEAKVMSYPVLLHSAIDARDCRGLAEFYRELLGLQYRPGDEPPVEGDTDDADWLVLLDGDGNRVVAIQEKRDTTPPTWPSENVPMQMHMDFKVSSIEELWRHRTRAEELGARLLYDRSTEDGEPLYVLADPAGHPFCLLVQ